MISITKSLKQDLQSLESIEERLNLLKDKYKGEEAYVFGCGPSLNTLNKSLLREKSKDKLVLCMKQSFDIVGMQYEQI